METPRSEGTVSQRFLTIALALALIPFLFAISAAQTTSPNAGQKIQGRTANSLLDIDNLFATTYPQWYADALASTEPSLPVPALPIQVNVPREDILNLPQEELQTRIKNEAGEHIYQGGLSVLAADGTTQFGDFSAAGVVRRGLGLISDELHSFFWGMAMISGLIVLAIALILFISGKGFTRLLNLGVALFAASLSLLVTAFAMRFLLGNLADSQHDVFASSLLKLGEDILSVPVRNNLIFCLLGLAFVAMALILSRFQASNCRRERS